MSSLSERAAATDQSHYIKIGAALIPYAKVKGTSRMGWILPGGKHTFVKSEAMKAASSLDKAIRSFSKIKSKKERSGAQGQR